jgi:hypothetical protein
MSNEFNVYDETNRFATCACERRRYPSSVSVYSPLPVFSAVRVGFGPCALDMHLFMSSGLGAQYVLFG